MAPHPHPQWTTQFLWVDAKVVSTARTNQHMRWYCVCALELFGAPDADYALACVQRLNVDHAGGGVILAFSTTCERVTLREVTQAKSVRRVLGSLGATYIASSCPKMRVSETRTVPGPCA